MEGKITFTWNKDFQADGYIIKQKKASKFEELVRVENIDLTTIVIPEIKEGIQNHFRVIYYKNKDGVYCTYREEDYYGFLSSKGQNIYKFPIPNLKKATKVDASVIIEWEKVSNEAMYAIFRKIPGEKWARVGITRESGYKDNEIDITKKYVYTVKCVSEDGKVNMSSCNYKGVSV